MDWLTTLWTLLVSHWQYVVFTLVLPFVAQAVSSSKWSGTVRGYIAFAVCLIVGFLTPLVAGIAIVPANAILLGSALFGGTTAAYLAFKAWKITCPWLDALLRFGSGPDVNPGVGGTE